MAEEDDRRPDDAAGSASDQWIAVLPAQLTSHAYVLVEVMIRSADTVHAMPAGRQIVGSVDSLDSIQNAKLASSPRRLGPRSCRP
jgi:hypothetical protein